MPFPSKCSKLAGERHEALRMRTHTPAYVIRHRSKLAGGNSKRAVKLAAAD
jgi:hypothetical protein